MKSDTIIYMARHGETVNNVERIIQGQTDSSLTENGIKQALDLAERLKDVEFDMVYSSDLLRAKRTAEIVISGRGLPVNTSKLLRERYFGTYEGQPTGIFMSDNKAILDHLMSLPQVEQRKIKVAPDIESDEEIHNRMITFFNEIEETSLNKTILVTTHGSIMRAFLNSLDWNNNVDLGPGAIKNTAYVKIKRDENSFKVEEVNGIDR